MPAANKSNSVNKEEAKLLAWLKLNAPTKLDSQKFKLEKLPGDASFRHYYRVKLTSDTNISYMLMVAPPAQEAIKPFVSIAALLSQNNIPVPNIYCVDPKHGYILLEDFGDKLLLDLLQVTNVEHYYQLLMDWIIKMQAVKSTQNYKLPSFDKDHINLELGYFNTWCLEKLLKIKLDSSILYTLEHQFAVLQQAIFEQPQVFIHRDYHSRNIMVLNQASFSSEIGIIDFQDAMLGPITYDLVSLLKDCYITWPRAKVLRWIGNFYEKCNQAKLISPEVELSDFLRWFDLTGIQRHLKVMGIFSRLKLRDNKHQYLKDTPRVMNYLFEALDSYTELSELADFMRSMVLPKLEEVWKTNNIEYSLKVA